VLTIRIRQSDQPDDAATLALQALGFILADERRAQRFLDLTGLTPDMLKAALTEESTHRAVIDFLCAHEPDLVAAAEALGITPQRLLCAFGQDFS